MPDFSKKNAANKNIGLAPSIGPSNSKNNPQQPGSDVHVHGAEVFQNVQSPKRPRQADHNNIPTHQSAVFALLDKQGAKEALHTNPTTFAGLVALSPLWSVVARFFSCLLALHV